MIETIDNAIDVLVTNIGISSAYVLDMLMRQGKFNIPLFIGSVFLFSICVWSFLYFVRKYRKEENQENNPPFSIIFCFVFFIYNIIFFFFVIQYSFQTVAWLMDPEAYAFNELTNLLLRFTK